MQKTMNRLIPTMLMAAACSATSAQVVDFVFVEDGVRDLTTMTLTDPGTGLTMTVDNPRDNTMFGDNTFARILGGLFLDGGLAPTVDWTFSENVRLVEYQIANQDSTDLFTLTQGGTVSAGNTTDPIGTFAFTNTSDTFTGGTPIVLTTSDHNGGGYSFSRVRVEIIVTPAPAYAVDGFGGTDLYRIDLAQGTETLVGNIGQNVLGMTFDPTGSRLYGYTEDADLLRINQATGASVVVGNSGLGFEFGFGMAFHNGRLYGAAESSEELYEINPNTGAVNLIGNIGQSVAGLASIGSRLYGIADTPDDNLVIINTSTGAATTVGPLGFSGSYLGASADASGRMWGVNSAGETYRINLGTGAGTQIADLANGYTALAINAGPSLIGDDYIANYYYNGTQNVNNNDTALVGPDAIGNFEGIIDYNIEPDNTLRINSVTTCCSWATGQMWEFLDLDLPGGLQIVDVIVIDATGTGWSNIDDSDISFTGDSILVDAADIVGITPALDQSVTLLIVPGQACPGDIADDFGILGPDGMVSFGDFLALLGLTGPCPGGVPGCTGDIADDFGILGGDGMVSFGDFLALLGLVGPCP